MLTIDDIKVLEEQFPVNDHKFNPRGFCYIKEASITRRLDQVDPSWEFVIVNITHRANIVTVTARLTVKGVTRENTGSQAIAYIKDSDTESGEPEKSATTDALRRCARLFGIGRYILSFPKGIEDMNALTRHLGGNAQQQPQQPQAQAPKQSAPVATPAPAKASEDGTISQMFNVLYKKAEYNQLSFKVGDDWLRVKLSDFLKLMPNPDKFAEWFAPLPDGKSALPRDLSVCYRHDGKKLVIVSVL